MPSLAAIACSGCREGLKLGLDRSLPRQARAAMHNVNQQHGPLANCGVAGPVSQKKIGVAAQVLMCRVRQTAAVEHTRQALAKLHSRPSMRSIELPIACSITQPIADCETATQPFGDTRCGTHSRL